MPNLGTKLRCRSTSVHQSNIFQDNKTFEEIIGKEPWTLRNYRSSWTSILHLTTPRTYESRTPCISCFPIRTLDSEHDPKPNTTPPHLLLKCTTTLNTRLPKSSTLNSTSAVNVNFSIWYDGRAMKGQTRKWIGRSLLN